MKSGKLCECGCGKETNIIAKDDPAHGNIKGQPYRFVKGHKVKKDPEKHFWSYVDKNGPIHPILKTRCWLWTGTVVNKIYGQAWFAKKKRQAHRVAWFLRYGKWPKFFACHKCDNTICVNYDHLFDGDRIANAADMVAKNRSAKGEDNASSKLTEEQILDIRAKCSAGIVLRVIAEEYGVSIGLIGHIKQGRIWRHVG